MDINPPPGSATVKEAKPGRHPRVVIIGGGFGGLVCAAELGNSSIDVTLLDRRNHNLFQPLLYQVATAALWPADIAEPIHKSLARFRNIEVVDQPLSHPPARGTDH